MIKIIDSCMIIDGENGWFILFISMTSILLWEFFKATYIIIRDRG